MRTYDVEVTTAFIRITRCGHEVISWTSAEWEANPSLVPVIAGAIRFVLTATPEEVEHRLLAGLVVAHRDLNPGKDFGMFTREEVIDPRCELRMFPATKFYPGRERGFLLYRVSPEGGEALVDPKPRTKGRLRAWCQATFGKQPTES